MARSLKNLRIIFSELSETRSASATLDTIMDFALVPYQCNGHIMDLIAANQQPAKAHPVEQKEKSLLANFLAEVEDLRNRGIKDPIGEFCHVYIHHSALSDDQLTSCPILAPHPEQITLDIDRKSSRLFLSDAWPYHHFAFYGVGTDPICCKMAVYHLMYNHLQGEIVHMNDHQLHRAYCCRNIFHNGQYHPYFRTINDPGESYIWKNKLPKSGAPTTYTPIGNLNRLVNQSTVFQN